MKLHSIIPTEPRASSSPRSSGPKSITALEALRHGVCYLCLRQSHVGPCLRMRSLPFLRSSRPRRKPDPVAPPVAPVAKSADVINPRPNVPKDEQTTKSSSSSSTIRPPAGTRRYYNPRPKEKIVRLPYDFDPWNDSRDPLNLKKGGDGGGQVVDDAMDVSTDDDDFEIVVPPQSPPQQDPEVRGGDGDGEGGDVVEVEVVEAVKGRDALQEILHEILHVPSGANGSGSGGGGDVLVVDDNESAFSDVVEDETTTRNPPNPSNRQDGETTLLRTEEVAHGSCGAVADIHVFESSDDTARKESAQVPPDTNGSVGAVGGSVVEVVDSMDDDSSTFSDIDIVLDADSSRNTSTGANDLTELENEKISDFDIVLDADSSRKTSTGANDLTDLENEKRVERLPDFAEPAEDVDAMDETPSSVLESVDPVDRRNEVERETSAMQDEVLQVPAVAPGTGGHSESRDNIEAFEASDLPPQVADVSGGVGGVAESGDVDEGIDEMDDTPSISSEVLVESENDRLDEFLNENGGSTHEEIPNLLPVESGNGDGGPDVGKVVEVFASMEDVPSSIGDTVDPANAENDIDRQTSALTQEEAGQVPPASHSSGGAGDVGDVIQVLESMDETPSSFADVADLANGPRDVGRDTSESILEVTKILPGVSDNGDVVEVLDSMEEIPSSIPDTVDPAIVPSDFPRETSESAQEETKDVPPVAHSSSGASDIGDVVEVLDSVEEIPSSIPDIVEPANGPSDVARKTSESGHEETKNVPPAAHSSGGASDKGDVEVLDSMDVIPSSIPDTAELAKRPSDVGRETSESGQEVTKNVPGASDKGDVVEVLDSVEEIPSSIPDTVDPANGENYFDGEMNTKHDEVLELFSAKQVAEIFDSMEESPSSISDVTEPANETSPRKEEVLELLSAKQVVEIFDSMEEIPSSIPDSAEPANDVDRESSARKEEVVPVPPVADSSRGLADGGDVVEVLDSMDEIRNRIGDVVDPANGVGDVGKEKSESIQEEIQNLPPSVADADDVVEVLDSVDELPCTISDVVDPANDQNRFHRETSAPTQKEVVQVPQATHSSGGSSDGGDVVVILDSMDEIANGIADTVETATGRSGFDIELSASKKEEVVQLPLATHASGGAGDVVVVLDSMDESPSSSFEIVLDENSELKLSSAPHSQNDLCSETSGSMPEKVLNVPPVSQRNARNVADDVVEVLDAMDELPKSRSNIFVDEESLRKGPKRSTAANSHDHADRKKKRPKLEDVVPVPPAAHQNCGIVASAYDVIEILDDAMEDISSSTQIVVDEIEEIARKNVRKEKVWSSPATDVDRFTSNIIEIDDCDIMTQPQSEGSPL